MGLGGVVEYEIVGSRSLVLAITCGCKVTVREMCPLPCELHESSSLLRVGCKGQLPPSPISRERIHKPRYQSLPLAITASSVLYVRLQVFNEKVIH